MPNQNDIKGFGCYTTTALDKGVFVSLYAGQLISSDEVLKRRRIRKQAHPRWGNYILTLMENDKVLGYVDATEVGDVGSVSLLEEPKCRLISLELIRDTGTRRFLNHSCDPNCVIQLVRWGPRAFPRPAIFVSSDLSRSLSARADNSGSF
jgi:histone-lysine N-methyltransferase SETMAR